MVVGGVSQEVVEVDLDRDFIYVDQDVNRVGGWDVVGFRLYWEGGVKEQ